MILYKERKYFSDLVYSAPGVNGRVSGEVGWRITTMKYFLGILFKTTKEDFKYVRDGDLILGIRHGNMKIDQEKHNEYLTEKREHEINKILPPVEEDIYWDWKFILFKSPFFKIKLGSKLIYYS